MRKIVGLLTGLIIFLVGFYPIRFLGDSLASDLDENFGRTYLGNLIMFFFPFLLSLFSTIITSFISGKSNKITIAVFVITILIVFVTMGHVLIP
jgi:hypothetical protein